jgi:rsbT co-antagonist protein RsbR
VHEKRLAGASQGEKQQIANIEAIINIRVNFICLFGEALEKQFDQDKTFEKLLNWGKETGEYIYNLGITLNEALLDTMQILD